MAAVEDEVRVSEPGTALAHRAPSVGIVARDAFDPRQVGLLKSLSKGAPEAEFNQFLELATRYELDPFMRQIWLVDMTGQGGWTVMVGRDGLLSMAHRDPGFLGMESNPVYSADKYSVKYVGQGAERHPEVSFEQRMVDMLDEQGKKVLENGVPMKTRGKLLGAYCVVFREGKIPTFFFAEYSQYLPKSENKRNKSPWSQYDDGMILKCAQSVSLRMAYSISGMVVYEEVSQQSPRIRNGAVSDSEPGVNDIDWGSDAVIQARLAACFTTLNELEAGLWLPKKIELELKGLDDQAREELLGRLERDIVERGGVVPEPVIDEPEVIDDAEFEVIGDADPVADDPDLGDGMLPLD